MTACMNVFAMLQLNLYPKENNSITKLLSFNMIFTHLIKSVRSIQP